MHTNSGDASGKEIRDENRKLVVRLMSKFDEECPDEESSLAMLYRAAEECGLVRCPQCPDSEVDKISDRIVKCKRCYKRIWITAGTLFHGVRRVRPYLATLYCHGNGAVFGSSWFSRLIGVADSLGAVIVKKIGLVICDQIPEDFASEPSTVFVNLLCRRSRETPAREHPRAELDKMLHLFDTESCSISDGQQELVAEIAIPELTEQEKRIFDLLSDEPLFFDRLCEGSGLDAGEVGSTLTFLELKGLVQALPGAKYKRAKLSGNQEKTRPGMVLAAHSKTFLRTSPDVQGGDGNSVSTLYNQVFEIVCETIRQVHGGLSRKCLQIYSALLWCHRDRQHWAHGLLIQACLRHPPIRYRDLVEYVSPPFIRVG